MITAYVAFVTVTFFAAVVAQVVSSISSIRTFA